MTHKKKWIYVGALTVAGIGFAVDRLFLASPATAEAKDSARPQKANRPPSDAGQGKGKAQLLDPSLAWLEKLAEPPSAHDVFAPSPEWLLSRKQNQEKTASAQAAEEPEPGSARAFQVNRELQATVVMDGGGFAVVDGQCLAVGDALEGFQLIRVTASQAVFQRGSERATLTLPMPPEQVTAQANQPAAHDGDLESAASDTKTPSGWGLLRLLWGSSRRH